MKAPRIALVHALAASVEPTREALARGWPEASAFNLLDDSLSRDLAEAGAIDGVLRGRFLELGRYCVRAGADAVLFTCSAFGSAIDEVRAEIGIPVLKPNEAMVAEAVARASHVALVATFAPTLASVRPEFEAEAARQERVLELDSVHAAGALEALQAGAGGQHDEIVAAAAAGSRAPLVALAQFSMARAERAVAGATAKDVLTAPDAAVARLRSLFDGPAGG